MTNHAESGACEPIEGMIVDPGARKVSVDLATYQSYLDETDLSEEDKRALIEVLWSIIASFVEMGFGVHPVQQAGVFEDNPCTDSRDRLNSIDQSEQASNQETARGNHAEEREDS